MTYVPPANAKECAIKPGEGWISCGWLAFEEWRKRTGKTYETTSEALSVGAGTITLWKKGRIPRADHGRRIEVLAGVPPVAWTWWLHEEGSPTAVEPAPESSERLVEPATLGSTREELLDCAARCKALARSPGLSAREQAAIEVQRKGALSELRRMDESAALEDHPDFESFLEDIIGATCDALSARGLTDPAIKGEIAQALRRRGELRDRQAA